MAKTILQTKCPYCGKTAQEVSRETDGFDDSIFNITLECGHTIQRAKQKADTRVEIISKDFRSPFDYQWVTTEFLEETDCNGLCLHEQGVGKTVIECMILKRNPHLFPALGVVPSGLRLQWMMEVYRWTGIMPQVITSSSDKPDFDTFPIVLVSIDTLRLLRPDIKGDEDDMDDAPLPFTLRQGQKVKRNGKGWSDEICARFNHVFIDESQKIKNSGSARTQALRKIVALTGGGSRTDNRRHIICLSGTNIEKHAGEFFVTLNLVRPELFPQETSFKIKHCEVDYRTGKIGGLKHPQQFREMTKDFIIRYKRADVLPDLPKVFRQFRLAEMPEGDVLKQYIEVVKNFQDYMDDVRKAKNPTDILGYLSKMRHITGVAKVKAAGQFVEEFLLENDDDRKLVIFLHHHKAAAYLMEHLSEICKIAGYAQPLYLNADLTIEQRMETIEEFKKPGNRIMLASTLAAGIGLNLQFCSDCLMMERQWNPGHEEQAEGRFPRPGSLADKINVVYLIAAGTIDDFLTQLVEQKRRNVAQTLDGEEMVWEQNSLMMELANILHTKGLKKWKLN